MVRGGEGDEARELEMVGALLVAETLSVLRKGTA